MARRGTLFGAGRGHPMYWAGCGGRGGCDKGAQGPGAPPRFEKRTTFHPSAIITFSRFGRLLQGGTPRTSGLRGGTPPTCAPRSGFRPTTKVAGVVGASTWAHNYALRPPATFLGRAKDLCEFTSSQLSKFLKKRNKQKKQKILTRFANYNI
jgi:hypothetical protein